MVTHRIICLVGLFVLIAGDNTEIDARGNNQKSAPDQPWTVRIIGKDTICTGVLIDRQWVLTTASCLSTHSFMEPERYKVTLGDYGGKKDRKQEIMVRDIFLHTYFNRATGQDNVALINLARKATIGGRTGVMAIRRLATRQLQDRVDSRTMCVVSGYGKNKSNGKWKNSNVLQSNRVDTLLNGRCSRIPWFVTESNICYKSTNDGLCRKDEGSPIVCEIMGTYWLTGLHVSQSANSCDEQINGAVSVAAYRQWTRALRRYGEGRVNFFLVKKWRMFYNIVDVTKMDPSQSPVPPETMQVIFNWYMTHVASTAPAGQQVNVDDFVQSLVVNFTASEAAFKGQWGTALLALASVFDQNNDGNFGRDEFITAFSAFGFNNEADLLRYFRSFNPKAGLVPLGDIFTRSWVYFLTNDNHAKAGNTFEALEFLQPSVH